MATAMQLAQLKLHKCLDLPLTRHLSDQLRDLQHFLGVIPTVYPVRHLKQMPKPPQMAPLDVVEPLASETLSFWS